MITKKQLRARNFGDNLVHGETQGFDRPATFALNSYVNGQRVYLHLEPKGQMTLLVGDDKVEIHVNEIFWRALDAKILKKSKLRQHHLCPRVRGSKPRFGK
jgi:hypothetical protein